MAQESAGQIILDVRANSDKLAGDLARAKTNMLGITSGMERGLNTSGMMTAISQLGSMMPGLGGQIAMVAGQFSGLNAMLPALASNMGAISTAASLMGAELTAAGAAAAAVTGAGIKAAMSREDLITAYTALLKSKDAATALIGEMQKLAARTPMTTQDVADAGRILLAYGFNVKEIIPTITALGDSAAAANKGAEGLLNLAQALGKVKSIGRLQGEELQRFYEAGVNPMGEIGKATHTSGGSDTQKLMEAGKISSSIAIPAIMQAINTQSAGAMDALSKTLSGRISTLKDNWNELLVAVGTPMVPAIGVAIEKAAEWLDRIRNDYLPVIRKRLGDLWDALKPVREALSKLFDHIKDINFPDLFTRMKLVVDALATPLARVVDMFTQLADLISDYFSGENPMTTFWVTFALALLPVTQVMMGVIETVTVMRDVIIGATLVTEGLTGNFAAAILGIAGAAAAGFAATKIIKKLHDDAKKSHDEAKMKADAEELGRQLESIAGKISVDQVSDQQKKQHPDTSGAADAAQKEADAVAKRNLAIADQVDKMIEANGKLRDAVKKMAGEQADAVTAGLKKQWEAHQNYIANLKSIYDRYVQSTAAQRSRMIGITVDNVGRRDNQPDWQKYRDTIESKYESKLMRQYDVWPAAKEQTPEQLKQVVDGISRIIYILGTKSMAGVAS